MRELKHSKTGHGSMVEQANISPFRVTSSSADPPGVPIIEAGQFEKAYLHQELDRQIEANSELRRFFMKLGNSCIMAIFALAYPAWLESQP